MDEPKRVLVDGSPVPKDHSHLTINPTTGQQRDYVVLSPEERAKGYVRPVRRTYIHAGLNPELKGCVLVKTGTNGCGARTTMAPAIAETYARDPKFYTGTFCVGCQTHRPLAEFYWEGTEGEIVGS